MNMTFFMKLKNQLIPVFLLVTMILYAQQPTVKDSINARFSGGSGTKILNTQQTADTISYSINTRFSGGSGTNAPFLSTANQYDRYSFAPNSLSVWGTAHKEIKNTRNFDYGFGMELDGNAAQRETRFFANEYYIQGKMYFLNMYLGAKQEVFGNQDPELSSGGILWSQNSRPIPKISIQTNGYIEVPYTKGYLAFKGGLSHGWFDNNVYMKDLLLHQKYASIRLGGSFPLNLNYGIQHVAQWGGISAKYGSMPVTLDNYLRIFFGKNGSSTATQSDQVNTLGNHIISQNLGLDLNLKSVLISLYWQNLTEDPPFNFITSTMNVQDGLWGMSVRIPTFKLFHSFVRPSCGNLTILIIAICPSEYYTIQIMPGTTLIRRTHIFQYKGMEYSECWKFYRHTPQPILHIHRRGDKLNWWIFGQVLPVK